MKKRIIRNAANHSDYWSNDTGWTDFLPLATVFSEGQAKSVNLPIDGEWVDFNEHYRKYIDGLAKS